MPLALLVAISGPKKASIFRVHPFQNGPRNGFARIKIIKSKRHIKTGTFVILCT